jgi:hypothetical protein
MILAPLVYSGGTTGTAALNTTSACMWCSTLIAPMVDFTELPQWHMLIPSTTASASVTASASILQTNVGENIKQQHLVSGRDCDTFTSGPWTGHNTSQDTQVDTYARDRLESTMDTIRQTSTREDTAHTLKLDPPKQPTIPRKHSCWQAVRTQHLVMVLMGSIGTTLVDAQIPGQPEVRQELNGPLGWVPLHDASQIWCERKGWCEREANKEPS